MKEPVKNPMTLPRLSRLRCARLTTARLAACLCMALIVFARADEALAKGSGGGSGGMDTMVAIVPMPIAIIHQSKVKGILMVEFYLETPSAAAAEKINQLMPRLLDAYRTGLNQFTAHELRLDRPVNLARLEIYLNRETRNVLGNRNIRVIYKQVMVQQK